MCRVLRLSCFADFKSTFLLADFLSYQFLFIRGIFHMAIRTGFSALQEDLKNLRTVIHFSAIYLFMDFNKHFEFFSLLPFL